MAALPPLTSNLTDLLDATYVQGLLQKFTLVTGVRASLIDGAGNILWGESANSNICTTFNQARGGNVCEEFYADLCQRAARCPRVLRGTCPFDLRLGLAPIRVNRQVLAYVKCGQVFHHYPSPSRICQLADILQVEAEPYRQALMREPVVAVRDFRAAMQLGWEIAQTISKMVRHNLGEKRLEARLQGFNSNPHRSLFARALESEECARRYRRLFENAPLVAYTLDNRLRTLYISPYCRRLFGYSDEEIQHDQLFWDRHIYPEDRHRVLYHRERCLQEGKSFTLEYRIVHRDHSVRHIINHTIPVIRNANLYCIDGFVYDISTRKQLEEQLVLTEKIRVLNDMSLSVAHEIRNPLTSIGGFARLLDRRMASDDPNRTHLEIILKEVARLEQTLNRVLDAFKPVNLNPTYHNVNKIILKVLAQLEHVLNEKNIELRTSLSAEVPEIEVDEHLFEQALHSLLKTALQNMKTGNGLTISTFSNGHHLSIEIKGIGLEAKPLGDSQLFFPFYREPDFDTGVGLPLSQQIISEHGGNVVIKNGSGQPATLVITLPLPADRL